MKTFFRIFDNKLHGIQRENIGFSINDAMYIPDEYLEAWDDNRNVNDGIDMWRNLWAHGRGQGYEIKGDALAAPDTPLVKRRTEKDLTARLTYLKARDTSLEQELEENADLEELVESGSEKLTASRNS